MTKVSEIISKSRFKEHIEACIDEIRKQRIESGIALFKRGPLERLQEKGVFNPENLAELYLKVLEGSLNSIEYPSAVRAFIKLIGDEAYRRTVAEVIKCDQQEQEPQM